MREIFLRAFVIDTVLSVRRPLCFSLSKSLSLSPLLCPLPASLILCQWCLHCISLQKANEREKKIHYGLVLRCSPQPFSCLDLWALLYIDAPAGWGESVPLSLSKHSENKCGERKWIWKKKKKKGKGGWEKREKNREKWERWRSSVQESVWNTDLLSILLVSSLSSSLFKGGVL